MAKPNWKAIKSNPSGKEAKDYYTNQRLNALRNATSKKSSSSLRSEATSKLKNIASKGYDKENIHTAIKVAEEYKMGNRRSGLAARMGNNKKVESLPKKISKGIDSWITKHEWRRPKAMGKAGGKK